MCVVLAALFAGLGVWQVERLHWKTALIANVEARLSAQPIPAPRFADWTPDDAYTRVTVRGVFLHDRETAVQAVTELGPGWWIITPLRTDAGIVLINRGFVPQDRKHAADRANALPLGSVEVQGLLRANEPGGAFLRSNAPAEDRWYSRDIQAIAHARNLSGPVAPYFIDADATPNPGGYPVGGLTIVRFHNSHFIYAVTWFSLCLLCLVATGLFLRRQPSA
nr:SURF1 family protein [Hyphomicrobium methylovorum]